MKLPKGLGMILLAAYLITVGVVGIFGIHLGQISIAVPVLAAAAGVCLLLGK